MRVTFYSLRRPAVIVSVLALTLMSGAPVLAAAGDGQSITISPTSSQLALNAGGTSSGVVKVIDGGDSDLSVDISATPYAVKGENYDPQFKTTAGFNDASSWFKFDKTTYALRAHQYQEVPYTIHVPANVGPGGYYATVFAETRPTAAGGSGVQTLSRVGSIFYIRINGSVSEGGSVASWRVPFFQSSGPLTSQLRIQNKGNVHFVANTTVTFKALVGGHKATINDTHVVLPATTRALNISWLHGPRFGIYKVNGTVTFLRQTQDLPAHYVVAISSIALILGLVVIVLLIAVAVYRLQFARRR